VSIDLTKLTPAPWEVFGGKDSSGYPNQTGENEFWCRNLVHGWDTTLMDCNHAEFIALARNIFDAMMRHGIGVVHDEDGWRAVKTYKQNIPEQRITKQAFPDPLTAVEEAVKFIGNLTTAVYKEPTT
jgi:hypothetical protein